MSSESVIIDYTNWRGERRKRLIRPVNIIFGSNEWHTEPQWLLHAVDLEASEKALKLFALSGIHEWRPTS